MIPELGHFSLIMAFFLSVILGTLPLVGASKNIMLWMQLARPIAVGIFVFMALALIALAYSFVVDDFSVQFVAQHSNSLLPTRYKVTAVWGGHEGSFLLWTFMLAGWMLAVSVFSKRMPIDFVARVLGIMGLISTGYILFMLATSNPFDRILPLAPANGSDLNSALQDIGFIIHPPTLYMGYVGFSVVFAFAISALLTGRLDSAWARWVRPWANTAWAILTVGIALGSWWAYYELGWGGWWAWDPVENPPLITWLIGTALIHSLAVTEKRGVFKSWTVMLAILAFGASLLGTFITRSGLLTSVHAFASDPTRGVFILGFIGVVIGGSLLLFAVRAPLMRSEFRFSLVSREVALLVNNILLIIATAAIFLGTLFPMVYQALTGNLISVGPPYFNSIFVPLMGVLIVFLGIGPLCRWKKTPPKYLKKQLTLVLVASASLGLLLPLLFTFEFSFAASLAVAFALWIMFSMLRDMLNKTANKDSFLLGVRSFSAGYVGMQTAHFGIAVMVLGICLTSNFSSEKSILLAPGESVELQEYRFEFVGTNRVTGANYVGEEATIGVYKNGVYQRDLKPQKRVYTASGTPSTEMAIDVSFLRDLFVTLGEAKGDNRWSMSIYIKPFIRWVWLGALFMALGGLVAVTDKRYRRLKEARKKPAQAEPVSGLQAAS